MTVFDDSRGANVLRPISSDNESYFLDPLRIWVSKILGFPPEIVRASWLQKPGTQPSVNKDWCALAVKGAQSTPIYQFGKKGRIDVPESGDTTQVSHDDYQVVISFYGPSAMFNAMRFRDGAQLLQNRRNLESFGLTLIRLDPQTLRLPDFAGEQWIDRYDVEFHIGRKVSRTYGVRTVVSADFDIFLERGKV